MTDIRLITIVGIRHYLLNDAAITTLDKRLSSPTHHTSLLLVAENENVHAPNRAVAAYADNHKIGYVAETDIPYARAAIGEHLAVEVEYVGLNEKHSAMLVTIEYEQQQMGDEYTPLFSLPPISGLTLPRMDTTHELLCAQIMAYADVEPWQGPEAMKAWDALHNPEHPVYTMAGEFAEHYGTSLSGDDMRVYSSLMGTPMLPKDIREKLQYTHRHFAATEAQCLRIWQKEYRQAEKILMARNGMWAQLAVQLNTQTQSTLALSRELRKLLMALPYDLFALHEKRPSLFASRLYRLHLSTQELDALKTYLIVYERVLAKHNELYMPKRKIEMPLYMSSTDEDTIRKFKREVRKYVSGTNHQTFVPGLVALIVRWERQRVVPRNLGGNVTAYCKALMAEFDCQFDIPNFRKLYRQTKGA